ncbi:MAG: hypothetical protein PHH47_00820 [Gallionella sp.]|nr:hypothetical protein [Gallionella sp.]
MGILILVILAMGIFTIIKWMVAFITPRIKRIKAKSAQSTSQSVVIPIEPGWDGFDKPAFIRRGIQYPILTVKKHGRTRKAKPVFAAA